MNTKPIDFAKIQPFIDDATFAAMQAVAHSKTHCGFHVERETDQPIIAALLDLRRDTGAGFLARSRNDGWYELSQLGAAYVIWAERRVK